MYVLQPDTARHSRLLPRGPGVRVDAGEIAGLDISGRVVVLVAEAPAMMVEGGWQLSTVVDDGASAEQTEAPAGRRLSEPGRPRREAGWPASGAGRAA